MYKRILVATDGSKLSKTAVTSAIRLAAACGAELVAIQVVAPYPISYFEGGMAVDAAEAPPMSTEGRPRFCCSTFSILSSSETMFVSIVLAAVQGRRPLRGTTRWRH
jgi:nucleotide-binding universal stress UspA family protein